MNNPISDDEWSQVREAALAVLNATFAGDTALRASHFEELRARLSELRDRHGEHPMLLETEADFCDEPEGRRTLYLRAIELAESAGLLTYTIRISLAGVLLDDFGEITHALTELMACAAEIETQADAAERKEWIELVDRCRSSES